MVSKIEEFVVDALIKYYKFDYDMFFEYLDDNVVWYGPKEGQYIVGKNNLKKAMQYNNKDIRYKIENIATQLISYSQNLYSVLITYRLYARYPDGLLKEHRQHIVLNGQKCRDQNGSTFWRCPFIHVSDVMPKKSDIITGDNKKVNKGVFEADSETQKPDNRLIFPSENYTYIYLPASDIRYISGGKGVLCYIHTADEIFEVHQLLKNVMTQLPEYFCRCHSSFIVNLRHVKRLSSREFLMDDGKTIPIPVKRYSKVREEVRNKLLNLEKL